MGYRHINNLYKDQTIMMFKECYALEKIHGTSAHISWDRKRNPALQFFSGGEKMELFRAIFEPEELAKKFEALGTEDTPVVVFGEAYGGKMQGMSDTYGKQNRFVVFEVKIGDNWLSVPGAEHVANSLGLEFVHYIRISTSMEDIDRERDADSIQAIRNGIGPGKIREGVVLRPLVEVTLNNGHRVMAKHKRDEFRETNKPRKVKKKVSLEVLRKAEEIAEEWVTEMRLSHVLDKFPGAGIERTGEIIRAMIEDIFREAKGEIVEGKAAEKSISRRTAIMFKNRLKRNLYIKDEDD